MQTHFISKLIVESHQFFDKAEKSKSRAVNWVQWKENNNNNKKQYPLQKTCQYSQFLLVRISLYSDLMRWFSESMFIFSQNTGKYGAENSGYEHLTRSEYVLEKLW